MQIRQATSADLNAVMQLIRRVVPLMHAAGNHQWDDEYPNLRVFEQDVKNRQLWIVEIDRQIAGVAAITMDQPTEYAAVGWDITETAIVIHRLAVDPSFRGKGVGIALMRQAETVAKEKRIATVRVDTNSANSVTQRLLPKLGYVYAGEIGLGFRPGLRFLCYEKQVCQATSTGASRS